MNFKPMSGYRANKLRNERVDTGEMHATFVWRALGSDPDPETITGVYYTA
jgi:hypothetical protein